MHRLGPCGRKVKDSQAVVAKTHTMPLVPPLTLTIRAAMMLYSLHATENHWDIYVGTRDQRDTTYSAHMYFLNS